MSIRRAGMALLLALMAAGLVGAPTTLAAGGVTRMVDDDGHAAVGDCHGHHNVKKQIQVAIGAAGDGDTILVCPGTYEEQILALGFHDLTIKSVRPWKAVILTPSDLDAPYLVGLGLSEGLTFQGFTLSARTSAPCEQLPVGILTAEATGVVIRGNRIRPAGDDSLGSCGYIEGIQVGMGGLFTSASAARAGFRTAGVPTPARATVAYNSIRDFQIAGIIATDPTTRALIFRNSVRFFHEQATPGDSCEVPTGASARAPRGVPAWLSRAAALAGAHGIRALRPAGVPAIVCLAFGIAQGNGASGDIEHNRVHSGPNSLPAMPVGVVPTPTPLMLAGILQLAPASAPGRSRLLDNWAFRNVADFALLLADGSTVARNRAELSLFGFFIDQTDGARIQRNRAKTSFAGIIVDDELLGGSETSEDNVFHLNNAKGNFEASCVDTTTGGAPGAPSYGTADTWTANEGEVGSSSPYGICGAIPPP